MNYGMLQIETEIFTLMDLWASVHPLH
ncbi:uncharacterized protein METZ01_LOCUS68673 [marine metagenome]|uniref:Uncharacterized protein n=1 Tax=marine metagenome TaxID=408172 RepID=A0A381TJ12_9ZZZZ